MNNDVILHKSTNYRMVLAACSLTNLIFRRDCLQILGHKEAVL